MKRLIRNKMLLKKVVYKTDNIIVQKIQEGKKRKRCYIIGDGHSLSVDDNNCVKKHDPFMSTFNQKINKDNTVYAFYFTFECFGLSEASREIAMFVDDLQEQYDEIFFIGHSKCGLCLKNASWYCKKKVTLITISTPHKGTIVADKKSMKQILNHTWFVKIYDMIFSDHNVDKDIIPNSIYMQNMHNPTCKEYINIVSSLRGIRDCRSIIDVFLLFLGRYIGFDGDGIVSTYSQMLDINCQNINIYCSHARSLKEGIKLIDN